MRKHLVSLSVLCLMLVPTLAFGAIKLQKSRFGEKGKIEVGGELSFSSTHTKAKEPKEADVSDQSEITFSPMVGYFVMPGLEIGGMITYTSESSTPDGGDESSSSMSLLGPFVAYHYKVSPVLHIYGRGYFTYMLSYENDAMKDTDVSGYMWAVGAGVAIPIGHKVGGVLRLGVDYQTTSMTMTPKGGDDSTSEVAGFVAGSGISVYF